LWIDHGQIRMDGGIEDVVTSYEGPEAGARVRKVLTDLGKVQAPAPGAEPGTAGA